MKDSIKDNMIMIIVVLLVLAGVFFASRWFSSGPVEEEVPVDTASSITGPAVRDVTFTASDGYKLSGTYSLPSQGIGLPTVILVHQYNTDRHDYDTLVPKLVADGYAVLAYDTRGSGASKNGPADVKDFPKDVVGAVQFLKTQKDVDTAHIGVIGASVGANEAFIASGALADIKVAVALSPSATAGTRALLSGEGIENFHPHNILVASDEKEKADADVIFARSAEVKSQKTYPGFGHGVSILASDQAVQDILSFLQKFLDVKG